MQTNSDRLFQEHQASVSEPSWLKSIRADAYLQFSNAGIPSRRHEDWRYTGTKALTSVIANGFSKKPTSYQMDYKEFISEDANSYLVFLDGIFLDEYSLISNDSKIKIASLNAGSMDDTCLDKKSFSQTLAYQDNSLEQLNLALFQSGCQINVRADNSRNDLLQILHISTENGEAGLICPRVIINLDSHAELTLLETFVGHGDRNWSNVTTDIQLKPHAKLYLAQEKILDSSSLLTHRSYLRLEEGAEASCIQFSMGGEINRSEIRADLLAPTAKIRLDGLAYGKSNAHLDHSTTLVHAAPQTHSEQVFKALLDDESQAIFDGKINILKHAQQVQAQQLSKALLLSESAEANTKPQLRIDADDVRCSHGATVGQINAQELFYLQSRGIPKADAEKILAKAFIRDLLGRIKNVKLANHLTKTLQNYAKLEI